MNKRPKDLSFNRRIVGGWRNWKPKTMKNATLQECSRDMISTATYDQELHGTSRVNQSQDSKDLPIPSSLAQSRDSRDQDITASNSVFVGPAASPNFPFN